MKGIPITPLLLCDRGLKNQQTIKKHENYPTCKELNVSAQLSSQAKDQIFLFLTIIHFLTVYLGLKGSGEARMIHRLV